MTGLRVEEVMIIFWEKMVIMCLGVMIAMTGFGRSDRAVDMAWVSLERWEQLTSEQREGFPPICRDFVIELRSKSDRLKPFDCFNI